MSNRLKTLATESNSAQIKRVKSQQKCVVFYFTSPGKLHARCHLNVQQAKILLNVWDLPQTCVAK